MSDSADQKEMIRFFEEYAAFVAQMSNSEEEKLQALLSNALPRIEQAISVAQANAMKLENMELQRQRVQEHAGCGGMTFSEIIEQSPEEDRQQLRALFKRIQDYVEDIKFHNTKSMDVARVNMKRINPHAEVLAKTDGTPSNAYVKAREEMTRPTMFETTG